MGQDDDDDLHILPIPVDAETVARLVKLADKVGKHPIDCAASLLHDLMRDDEMENVHQLADPPTTTRN